MREHIIDILRAALKKQYEDGYLAVLEKTITPDVYRVRGNLDLYKLAQAVEDAR